MRSVKLIMVGSYVIVLVMSYLTYKSTQHDPRTAILVFCVAVLWISLVSLLMMWMARRSINAGKAWVERHGLSYNSGEFRFIARGPYTSLPSPYGYGTVIKVSVKNKDEENKVAWLKWSGFSLSKDPEVTWE